MCVQKFGVLYSLRGGKVHLDHKGCSPWSERCKTGKGFLMLLSLLLRELFSCQINITLAPARVAYLQFDVLMLIFLRTFSVTRRYITSRPATLFYFPFLPEALQILLSVTPHLYSNCFVSNHRHQSCATTNHQTRIDKFETLPNARRILAFLHTCKHQ